MRLAGPAATAEHGSDLSRGLARALGHVRPAVSQRGDPVGGRGVVPCDVTPALGHRMGGLAVKFDARPVAVDQVVQVDATRTPGHLGLAPGTRQLVRPLDVADVADFEHRLCAVADVVEGAAQDGAPADLTPLVSAVNNRSDVVSREPHAWQSQPKAASMFFAVWVRSRTVSSILVRGGVREGCRASASRSDRCRRTPEIELTCLLTGTAHVDDLASRAGQPVQLGCALMAENRLRPDPQHGGPHSASRLGFPVKVA